MRKKILFSKTMALMILIFALATASQLAGTKVETPFTPMARLNH